MLMSHLHARQPRTDGKRERKEVKPHVDRDQGAMPSPTPLDRKANGGALRPLVCVLCVCGHLRADHVEANHGAAQTKPSAKTAEADNPAKALPTSRSGQPAGDVEAGPAEGESDAEGNVEDVIDLAAIQAKAPKLETESRCTLPRRGHADRRWQLPRVDVRLHREPAVPLIATVSDAVKKLGGLASGTSKTNARLAVALLFVDLPLLHIGAAIDNALAAAPRPALHAAGCNARPAARRSRGCTPRCPSLSSLRASRRCTSPTRPRSAAAMSTATAPPWPSSTPRRAGATPLSTATSPRSAAERPGLLVERVRRLRRGDRRRRHT